LPLDVLAATAVAAGYAFVGEVGLGRTSRGAAAWSASFLVGTGIGAALLFPLSLLAPAHAVDAELALLLLAAAIAAWRRSRERRAPRLASSDSVRLPADPVARLLLAAVVALALFFAVFNLWYGNSWDSVQVFATRAKLLFHQGGLTRWWFPEDGYDTRLLAYPPMISLTEALVARVRGAFDFDRLKPIFFFFYLSLLFSTYAAARAVLSRRWALVAVLWIALLPELMTRGAAGGYVDMPMAAYVAASVAVILDTNGARNGGRAPLPWLLGSMTAVKQEGMLLAVVGCTAIAAYWMGERPRRIAERLRVNASAMAVLAAFMVSRVAYVKWTRVHDTTWGPFDADHVSKAVRNLGAVIRYCLHYMLDPRMWGLFWPAFLVAAIATVASGPARLRVLALATAAAAAIEAALFLFTNWDVQVHIEGAYSRLLAQLAPAAVVVIVSVGSRAWSAAAETRLAMPAGSGAGAR
jgi:hypothetical protein